eukprot:3455613-Pyramimonas_sp.AAC.1
MALNLSTGNIPRLEMEKVPPWNCARHQPTPTVRWSRTTYRRYQNEAVPMYRGLNVFTPVRARSRAPSPTDATRYLMDVRGPTADATGYVADVRGLTSSGVSLFSRALPARRLASAPISISDFLSASRMMGVMRPLSVDTAMLMSTEVLSQMPSA